MRKIYNFFVLIFIVLTLALITSCASVEFPSNASQYEEQFENKVLPYLRDNLRFDPYGNEVYFDNEDEAKREIGPAYSTLISNLNSSMDRKRFYGAQDKAVFGGTEERYTYTLIEENSLINALESRNIQVDKSGYTASDLRKNGWVAFKSGHAREDKDLAQYNVPVTFAYWFVFNQSTGGELVIKKYIRTESFSISSKTPKDAKEASTENTEEDEDTVEERLKRLKEMLDKELITEEEYNEKKKDILEDL